MIGNRDSNATEGAARFLAVVTTPPPEKVEKTDRWQKKEMASAKAEKRKMEIARAVEATTAPLKRKLAEKEGELVRKDAAVSILVQCKDELIAEKKVLEAQLASATSGRSSMKLRFVIGMFVCAFAFLYGINSRTSEKVDGLTDYYIAHEFGLEAMNGKTYVEVTPQVENIGISRFVPLVRQLPYTDAATLERLFSEESWVVTEMWGEGTNTVVQMNNWYYDFLGCLDKEMVGLGNENRPYRSVLIHPHPVSIKVYLDAKENAVRGHIYSEDFAEREHYAVADESAMRLKTCAEFSAPITRRELAGLGNMRYMWDYGNGVLFLTKPYGAGERFVRLTDADYRAMQSQSCNELSGDAACALKEVNWDWWDEVTYSANKEEQTAVK